jgi:hypothetical protein
MATINARELDPASLERLKRDAVPDGGSSDEEDAPDERARKIRESLSGRVHSDSGAIQNEDRQR